MSMYRFVWTAHFTRSAEKFKKRHPELRAKLAGVLRALEKDPFQPHLKYHPLSGKLKGIQAVSITDKYRISLTIVISEKEIILLDIGTHKVKKSIKRIIEYPKASSIERGDVRKCLLHKFPYKILYSMEDDHILIIAIAHLHRKPDYWIEREGI